MNMENNMDNKSEKTTIFPLPMDTQSTIQPSRLLLALNDKTKKSKKLRKKLDKVSHENKKLNDLIKQKNTEIANLKMSSSSLNEIINTIPYDSMHYGPAAANYKLIEISNKNRKLSIELVTTKSKLTKKELQIQKNQNDLQALERKFKLNEKFDETSRFENTKTTITEMRSHISELSQHIKDLKQQNADLQYKLEAASQCLQHETGHAWDIDAFILNPTNWRGRAEKIKNMEQEIAQYNDQLEGYKQLLKQETARGERKLSARSPRSEPPNDGASKNEKTKNRKMLAAQNALLKSELEKEKSKLLSLKVRNEYLNEELIKYMSLYNNAEQHSKFNDDNFTSLSEVLIQQQNEYDDRIAELNSVINNLRLQLDQSNNHKQTLKSKMSIVETMLSEKYNCIEKLLENNKKLEKDLKSYCGGFLFSCRDLRKEEFVAVLSALEAEKGSLLKKINIQAETIKDLNMKNNKLKEGNRGHIIKISNLECQLEKSLSKKGPLQKIVKFSNDLKTPSPKPSFTKIDDEQNESVTDLKEKLKVAETTIDELQQRLEALDTAEKQHSQLLTDMVNKTKDTILETIRKFRSCSV